MKPDDLHLLYEDTSADAILEALREAVDRFGTLLCSASLPVPGLPGLPEGQLDTVWSDTLQERLVDTPWGLARRMYGSALGDYTLHRFTPSYCIVEPRAGVAQPQAQAPEPGFAVLDTVTGMAAVYVQDEDGEPVPVHSLRVYLDNKRGAHEVADRIRSDLARAGIPIYPTHIYRADSLPYPWEEKGTDFRTARVTNGEVGVPVVGFALDTQTQELVYLHVVGAKAAIRSVWATLNQGGNRKSVTIHARRRDHLAYTSKNYVTYSAPVDPETGVYRLSIVDRRAVEHEVHDRAYLLVARDGEGKEEAKADADLDHLFAGRLDAVLPIPILPEWGRRLRQEGVGARLVSRCTTGGDVEAAYAMTADGRWTDLVAGLVQSGELAVE